MAEGMDEAKENLLKVPANGVINSSRWPAFSVKFRKSFSFILAIAVSLVIFIGVWVPYMGALPRINLTENLLPSNGVSVSNSTVFKPFLPSYPLFPANPLAALPDNSSKTEPKVILFWTGLFGRPDWALGAMGSKPFELLKCSVANCFVTTDRKLVQQADVVLINFRDDFKYNDLPTKAQRKPNQKWTFVLWEAPDHTYSWLWQNSQRHARILKKLPNFFNWTMTYRLDSDVAFNYGRYNALSKPQFSRTAFDRLAGKNKSAVWMNSHCDTPSHRETYANELSKYIDVGTIGSCGSNLPNMTETLCARPSHFGGSSDKCLAHLSATYKFYLAFENALCRDYVTEKLYRAAKLDLIPVVLTGADMSLIAPPHSYIDAHQFSSPAELAKFLKKVGSDSALYNSYFWWKPFYDVENLWDKRNFLKHFCDLCSAANSAAGTTFSSYADMDRWWTTDGRCRNGLTSWPPS